MRFSRFDNSHTELGLEMHDIITNIVFILCIIYNNLIILPFLWLLLHYKHLCWSYVRWEFVLLSVKILAPVFYKHLKSEAGADTEFFPGGGGISVW